MYGTHLTSASGLLTFFFEITVPIRTVFKKFFECFSYIFRVVWKDTERDL